jgi:hypothetical protein
MAFKLIESAQAYRLAVHAPHLVALVRADSVVNGAMAERFAHAANSVCRRGRSSTGTSWSAPRKSRHDERFAVLGEVARRLNVATS